MKNHYETLNVAEDASESDVRKAFRNLAKKHHPDKNQGDPKAEAKFKEISAAYETLARPVHHRGTHDMGREAEAALRCGGIRFVKIPAEEPEVTFGRSPGDQYRHIQLKIPTVSRMHARMRYKDGDWWIENLSSTNPVVLNGHSMGADTRKSLDDGDRIEMGEVVFRYWV